MTDSTRTWARRLGGPLALTAALAFAGAAAPAASGNDVWLWVCQGPEGQILGDPGENADPFNTDATACSNPSLRALTAHPSAPGIVGWSFSMPGATTLKQLTLDRSVSLGTPNRYLLQAGTTTLEQAGPGGALNGPATYLAGGGGVSFTVTCEADCPAGKGATVSRLGFRVEDTSAPAGAVAGWRSPASGSFPLYVSATDTGVGLQKATLRVDGVQKAEALFGDGSCADLSPGPASVDLSYARVGQPDEGTRPVGCLTRGVAPLTFDTSGLTESTADNDLRRVEVVVTDFAGNSTTVMDRGTEIRNRPQIENIAVRTMIIGSGVIDDPIVPGSSNPDAPPGVEPPAPPGVCRNPALTMLLDQPPLRTSRGVVVLRRGKRYRFAGELTCNVGGKRRAAAKGTQIRVRTTTARERRTTVRTRNRGAIRAFLRPQRSGTIVFRYDGTRGASQVTIRLKVERPLPKRTSIYGRWLRFESPSDRVRFTRLEARSVPAGATVRVRCRGTACPGAVGRRFALGRARTSVSLLRALSGSELRPGTAIDVTITKRGFTGVGKLYCVRSGQRVLVRSYLVGARRPGCGTRAAAASERPPVRGAIHESG